MNLYRGKSSREVYLASLLYDSIDDNNFSAVQLLLCDKEADPNLIIPSKGISSFHLAIGCDDEGFALKVTRLILQNGGNPNVRSDDGLTPVHIAAAWGRTEILKMLLNCGGDCECRDSDWMTPIHYAIKESCRDCLELLESYLPDNYDIICKEKEDCCSYKLDKIIVNNGYVKGEYELCPQLENAVGTMDNLANLPKSDTTNYVLDWFETHIDSRGGKTFIKNRNSLDDTTEDEKCLPYESSFDESENDNEKKRYVTKFRKSYKKKAKVDHGKRKIDSKSISSGFNSAGSEIKNEIKEVSSESGILTLNTYRELFIDPDNFNTNSGETKKFVSKFPPISNNLNPIIKTVSNITSEYLTCSSGSVSVLDKNILAITRDSNLYTDDSSSMDNNNVCCDSACDDDDPGSTELSFVTVSEYYKYEDKDEGITLYEKRIVKISSDCGESVKTLSTKMSSLPESFEYDAETLKKELTLLGFTPPGPITTTTKRVYLMKLYQLKKRSKRPQPVTIQQSQPAVKRVYSPELEKTLRNPKWTEDLSQYRQLEDVLVKEFSTPSPLRKWRGGHSKSSFTYLLLDPRKSDDLPCRAHTMDPQEVWKTFLSAIFYIGKGKRNRPYAHLYEAVNSWRQAKRNGTNKKIQTILDIWTSDAGVICLHVFQNIIPAEAYTREATMISALKMENLSNEKNGEFYGTASTWRGTQKTSLGTFLLYKAMTVFLTEGERQLYATDVATA